MKALSPLVLILLFIVASMAEVNGQSKFNERSRKLNKFKYRTHIGKPSRKCSALKRKRKNGPDVARKPRLGKSKKPKVKKMAESDLSYYSNHKYDTWISSIASPIPTHLFNTISEPIVDEKSINGLLV